MAKDSLSLYSMAKYVSQEITMQSQLEASGSNKARTLEKIEKNENYIKNMTIMMKVVISFYFLFLSTLPLFGTLEIMELLANNESSLNSLILTGSVIYSLYFGLQIVYLLVIGMPAIGELMSGSAFRYLETLPIKRRELRKLGIMTVFRNYNAPLITMLVAFPVVMLIGTQNILIFIACVFTSLVNFIVTISILTLLSERMASFMKKNEEGGKKSAVLRIMTMLGYVGMTFIVIFLIQSILGAIDEIFAFFSSIENPALLNYLLSLIPYPFGATYFITLMFSPTEISPFLWITAGVGLSLSILFARKVLNSALISLNSITSEETRAKLQKAPKFQQEEKIKIQINPVHPIKAFIKKDLSTASRDIQVLMFFILPIALPLFSIISIAAPAGSSFLLESNTTLWGIVTMFAIMASFILVSGLLDMDESGSSILASLPIVERHHALGKLIIIGVVQTIGYILPTLLLIMVEGYLAFLGLLVASLPMLWGIMLILFILKARLFGKVEHKYVLTEFNPERKVLKWILMAICGIGLFGFAVISYIFISMMMSSLIAALILILVGLIYILSGYFILNSMFPKPKQ